MNRDRHGANIEVLRNRRNHRIRLAPLFDHGLSLIYNCQSEQDIKAFDVMADKPVQCYVGSRSATENLKLIEKTHRPAVRSLEERDRVLLFRDLSQVLPAPYLDKIWEMIWKRWRYYEDLCDQG